MINYFCHKLHQSLYNGNPHNATSILPNYPHIHILNQFIYSSLWHQWQNSNVMLMICDTNYVFQMFCRRDENNLLLSNYLMMGSFLYFKYTHWLCRQNGSICNYNGCTETRTYLLRSSVFHWSSEVHLKTINTTILRQWRIVLQSSTFAYTNGS